MENASKALMMAAGILITILVIGAAIFMYRQITAPEKEKVEETRIAQIQEFNNPYLSYEKTKVHGSELLSLVNKMRDYNTKIDKIEKYDGYMPMENTIKVKTPGKYIFTSTSYTIEKLSQEIEKAKTIQDNKNYGGEQKLDRLVGLIGEYSIVNGNISTRDKFDKEVKEKLGLDPTKITVLDIQKYAEYIEFKRKTFKHTKTEYDTNGNGRITKMSFEER